MFFFYDSVVQTHKSTKMDFESFCVIDLVFFRDFGFHEIRSFLIIMRKSTLCHKDTQSFPFRTIIIIDVNV